VVFLKDVDDVRHDAGVLHAAVVARDAVVQAEEQFVVAQADAAELLARRVVADLDGDFLEVLPERRRHVCKRPLDQLREPLFAHLIRHR
jgi:hypothetical protein